MSEYDERMSASTTRSAVEEAPSTANPPIDVSIVIPARNEAAYLRGGLSSITALDTDYEYEVIVVDGASTDDTRAIAREYNATVVEEDGSSIAVARNLGASHADGEWLVFIDADTRVQADYLTEMLGFVEREGLAAASSRCRMTGPLRAKLMEGTINQLFPRLASPVLPGFNCVVHHRAFDEVGGFPDVPNEDTAFSRRLGRQYPTAYHPDILVTSSGRRIAADGLTGTLWHYLRLDAGRLQSSRS
ncbi:family 2 glycosyl transferase [Natrialba chahannaoensis JCM 10990]|uniref:Family 2 glycosyl transferase n=2 Tax=Natrialba chahannaoensis TaxID=68911 RepID=M0ARI4_9EURY|nr:family 2 glycosyl transferase [Natrialba chahannaoensis JCM 10990]